MLPPPAQDVFPQSDGLSTWNHLYDAVYSSSSLRAQYLRRLRSIMDR